VLHAQDCLVASALLEARRRDPALARCPLLRTVHHVERFESPYLAECQRRSIVEADMLLSVSRATDDDLGEIFGRRAMRVDNGVDLGRFARAEERAAETRRSLGLGPGAFVVLSVGGVEPRKNSLRCLEAMASVLSQAPQVTWLLAGGASVLDHRAYQAEFEQRLASLPVPVQSRIRRTGVLAEDELTGLYGASDALLCASAQEGFGLCVLEAAAARRPVVVSRRAPFTDYLPENAALFVDPDSADAIAGAVLELLAGGTLPARLAAQAYSVARELTWERSAVQHAAAYRMALNKREERPRMGAPRRAAQT
jgi:glycosyltransferase-like protein